MPDQGGGPVPYIAVQPSPSGQLSLFIPETVLQTATDEQRRKLAVIQVDFAHRVSSLLARAYGDISEVLRDGAPKRE